jgi:hypothetical protein
VTPPTEETTVEVIVAGVGCKRCHQLKQMTEEALKELGADHVTLKNLDSLEDICQCGIMLLPALVVDGKLLVSGQVPSKKRLLQLLQEGLRLAAERPSSGSGQALSAEPKV